MAQIWGKSEQKSCPEFFSAMCFIFKLLQDFLNTEVLSKEKWKFFYNLKKMSKGLWIIVADNGI